MTYLTTMSTALNLQRLYSLMTYLTTMSTALKLQRRKVGLWVSSNFEIILIKFRSSSKCAGCIAHMGKNK